MLMQMRKAFKLALNKEQIAYKNTLSFIDGFEIHLQGDERDNFALVPSISKPIYSVHYPLNRCDVMDVAHEFRSEYAKRYLLYVRNLMLV